MSRATRRRLPGGGLALTLAFLVLLGAGYGWSARHVRHITGDRRAGIDCLSCHLHARKQAWFDRFLEKRYLSPLDLAISPDGRKLAVTAQDADALLVVALGPEARVTEIPVGARPHGVVLGRDGTRAYVSNQWANTISVVDLAREEVIATLPTGSGPAGLALGPEERFLYVANSFSDDVSVIELETGTERRRLVAGRNPYAVALSPDGGEVYVTNRITNPVPYRTPPVTEVTVIGTRSRVVEERRALRSAHLLEGIAFTPDGDLALVTLMRPKNLLPATQVDRGWVVTNGLGVIERGGEGRVVQLLLDEPGAFFADPCQVVVTPDARLAFVSHAGADRVTAVDLPALRRLIEETSARNLALLADHLGASRRYVVARIPTRSNPKGLALSPDGRRLYVAERLSDSIAVIDVETLERRATLDLGGPRTITMTRRGARVFNSSGGTFHGQFSCRSCHPDGHEDALVYDLEPDGLGRNLLNTRSLRDIGETAPYKWNGKNVSLYMQCGIRFSRFITRSEPFETGDLDALAAFIVRGLSHPPNRYRSPTGGLTASQRRGKAIFERTRTRDGRPIPPEGRCITCHPPPHFTNRRRADVGTLAPTDSRQELDVAHLNNIYESAPYLHDGSARTLEEIWTRFNPKDRHGVANDLTKAQLNDLVEYLRTL